MDSDREPPSTDDRSSEFDMVLSYRYRLEPSKAQHVALAEILEFQRLLYNADLKHRRKSYQVTEERGLQPERISFPSRCKELTTLRRDVPEWFGAIPANLARWTLKRADLAYQAFFRRCQSKAGKAGFPRFRSSHRWRSFGFHEFSGIRFDAEAKRLRFQGLPGALRVSLHRPIPDSVRFLSCAFTREGRRWFVSFQLSIPTVAMHISSETVGIDLRIQHLAALSTGEEIVNPKILERKHIELRRRQRALARCQRGSKRRLKVCKRLARVHQSIVNARTTYAHQVTVSLTQRFGIIAVEDLRLRNLTASAKGTAEAPGTTVRHKAGLNRALLDVAPGRFVELLAYKAERAGGQVVKVNPRGTSIQCSSCGTDVPKELRVRTHACFACGLTLDRDHNAARNILSRALDALGRGVVAPGLAKPLATAA